MVGKASDCRVSSALVPLHAAKMARGRLNPAYARERSASKPERMRVAWVSRESNSERGGGGKGSAEEEEEEEDEGDVEEEEEEQEEDEEEGVCWVGV